MQYPELKEVKANAMSDSALAERAYKYMAFNEHFPIMWQGSHRAYIQRAGHSKGIMPHRASS